MFSIILFIEVIVCILLIVVVLMQASKGGGLAGTLGVSGVGTVFGVRRTADFLVKTTTVLATIFIALSLIANIFFLSGDGSTQKSIIQEQTPTTLPPPLPPSNFQSGTPHTETP